MATARPRRRRPRRVVAVLLLLVAIAVVVALVALAPGGYETYPRSELLTSAGRRAAPAWTRTCWPPARTRGGEPTCAHVSGRVVWIQHEDPDGDGDRHLVIVGGLRARIVKIQASLPVSDLPSYGTRIDAVGYLYRGSSGHLEVIATRLVPGGPSGR